MKWPEGGGGRPWGRSSARVSVVFQFASWKMTREMERRLGIVQQMYNVGAQYICASDSLSPDYTCPYCF